MEQSRDKLQLRLMWERIRNGDEAAYFDLYAQLYPELVRFGIRSFGDADLASEATDNVFLSIWEKRANLERVEQVQSYLISILKRKLIRLTERRQKLSKALQAAIDQDEWTEMSYEEFIIRVQSDEIVQFKLKQALNKLTFRQKQIVQLKFFEGLTYEQIAEKTDMTVKTCYNTLYDALKIMRKEFYDF
ncbi:RNA polymerase sigma factor [Sphingobacterium kyonggiense]